MQIHIGCIGSPLLFFFYVLPPLLFSILALLFSGIGSRDVMIMGVTILA